MAPTLPVAIKAQIERSIQSLYCNLTPSELRILAANYKTSYETIRSTQLRLQRVDNTERRRGRRRIATPDVNVVVRYALEQAPYLYQDEISDLLETVFGITLSQSSISRLLKRLKITKKRLRIEAT